MKSSLQRQTDIVVVGYDDGTREILKTALLSGFRPRALFAPSGSIGADSEIVIKRKEIDGEHRSGLRAESYTIPVIRQEALQQLTEEEGLSIVIGRCGHRERDFFREDLQFARHRLKASGRILHPAFLGDFHANPKRRFAIIGFPGSGNMIFQNISWRLSPPPPVPVWASDPVSAAVSQYALAYWYSLNNFIAGAFDDAGRWEDITGPTHLRNGSIYVELRDQTSPAVVAGLPQRSYIWSNPWHMSHEPLTKRTIEFFGEQNFHILQILRHPLDLAVSNAAKITAFAGDRAPQILLQNDEWMNGMLQSLERYYEGFAEYRGANGVSFLHYEELLASPVATIRKMAKIFNVDCDDVKAESIWAALEGKPLSDNAGHLWDPRAGKWREFISPRFAERVCKSRLREYAEAVGYRLEPEDFIGNRAEIPENKSDLPNIAWQDARWEASTGKRYAFNRSDVFRVHDNELGLLFICGEKFAEAMERLRKSRVLQNLLHAARITSWADEPLIAEFLKLR